MCGRKESSQIYQVILTNNTQREIIVLSIEQLVMKRGKEIDALVCMDGSRDAKNKITSTLTMFFFVVV